MAIWTNSDGLKIRFATEEASLNIDSGSIHEAYTDSSSAALDPLGNLDSTDAIQSVIDLLPDTGGEVILPSGTFLVSTIRLDGTNGDKSNVVLSGQGRATTVKKLNHSLIATTAGQKASVIQALNGHGFGVKDLNVEGNYSRGGVSPPYAARWTLGQVWGAAGTAYSVSSSGTAGTQDSTDKIYVVTVTGAGQTSSASNISNDVSSGYVTEVTSSPWDESTGTGYYNSYDVDDDYAYRHGIYFNGTTETMEDCWVDNVKVTNCMYGGVLIGAGPLFASRKYYGATRGRIHNSYFASNRGSNIGGGYSTYKTITNCTIYAGASSGIRLDEGSHYSSISGCTVNGNGSEANGGINVYNSSNCTISNNVVNNASPGIWINSADGNTLNSNSVVGASTIGISIASSNFLSLVGNYVTTSTSHGIQISASKYVTANSNVVYLNGGAGIRVSGSSSSCTVVGNVCMDNSTAGGSVNSGINVDTGLNSTYIGNKCADSRSGGSKTQNYGINELSTASNNTYIGNALFDNKTGASVFLSTSHVAFNATGTSTDIDLLVDPRGAGVLSVGTYTVGAATDSTGYITIKDAGGTSRKLMVQA